MKERERKREERGVVKGRDRKGEEERGERCDKRER